MKNQMKSIGYRLSVFVAMVLLPSVGHAQGVAVVDSATRVKPSEVFAFAPQNAPIDIYAARNEFGTIQLVLMGGSAGMANVDIGVDNGSQISGDDRYSLWGNGNEANRKIGIANIRYFREGYYDTGSQPSTPESDGGLWPDVMLPKIDSIYNDSRPSFYQFDGAANDIPVGENRVVMVEVLVPADFPAQTYQGRLLVTWTGGSQVFQIRVHVSDFTLPATSSLKSSFSMAVDHLCNAHFENGMPDWNNCATPTRPERAAIALKYGSFLLDHRVTADVVSAANVGGSAGSYDWSAFETTYGNYINGNANTRLVGAKPTTIAYQWGGWSDPNVQAEHDAWWNEAVAKGWASRTYNKICDEPKQLLPDGGRVAGNCYWPDIAPNAAIVHAASPDFRTMVTTDIVGADNEGVTSDIDILDPIVNRMDDKPGSSTTYSGNQRSTYDPFLDGGTREVWWYQSCVQHGCGLYSTDPYNTHWTARMVDTPTGLQLQAQEWLSYLYNVSGEHYYETVLDLPTAYLDQTATGPGSPPLYFFAGYGDGTLLYPGTPAPLISGGSTYGIGGPAGSDIPLASYRLKMIRAGMEGYEYEKMLAGPDGGNRPQVIADVAPLFSADGGVDFHAYYARSDNGDDAARLQATRTTLRDHIYDRLAASYPQSLSSSSASTWYSWNGPLSIQTTGATSGGPPRTFAQFGLSTTGSGITANSGGCDARFAGQSCAQSIQATGCQSARTISYYSAAATFAGAVSSATHQVSIPSPFSTSMYDFSVHRNSYATEPLRVAPNVQYAALSSAAVSFGISGCPPGATCSLVPGTYGTGSPTNAELKVAPSFSTPPDLYTISITSPQVASPCGVGIGTTVQVLVKCQFGAIECTQNGVDGCYVPKVCDL